MTDTDIPEVAEITAETAAYLASQTVPPPGGHVERRPVTSRLLRASVLARDTAMQERVRMALTIAGIHAVDPEVLLPVLLAAPLVDGGRLVDAVEVTEVYSPHIQDYEWDPTAISDDMIESAIEQAYDRREELGLALTGPAERGA